MAKHPRRALLVLTGAGLAAAAGLLVLSSTPVVWGGQQVASTKILPLPTRAEAESLLNKAVSFARTHDYDGLCRAIAQDWAACKVVLERANVAHAMPSSAAPFVEEAIEHPDTGSVQGAEVLRIRGTHADGSSYASNFSAVRTTDGLIRSQNAVYWFSSFQMPSA
ncbi:hypothetical protein [Amycolatopsis sp. GA6-003]|uniref:hypothetical protein n=1 Tax=Amycolatopsis sp. GA6-003 TaxID=2652444 RepID=UPI00391735E6